MNTKVKKGLNIALNVVLWLFLIFALVVTVMVISSTSNSDGLPSIFGKIVINIQSDSMKPEFKKGDMIFDAPLTAEEKAKLSVDDVITFYADLDQNGENEINTHRIVEIISATGTSAVYKTKGDNNQVQDSYNVPSNDVLGKYTGAKIGGVGSVLTFLRTSLGFFLCIVLPLLLFFIYELFVFIKTIVKMREEKIRTEGVSKDVEEAIKQKAIEEYLRQQKEKEEAEKK